MWFWFCLIIFHLLEIIPSHASEYNLQERSVPPLSKAFDEPSQISFLSVELTDETFFLLAYKLVAIQLAASNLISQIKTGRKFQWPPSTKILLTLSKLLQERRRSDIENEIKETQNILRLMITSKPFEIRRMSTKNFGEKIDLNMVAFSKWLVDNSHFKLDEIKNADAYLIAYYFLKFYKPLLLPSKDGWQSEVMNRLLGDVKKEIEKQIFLTNNLEVLYKKFEKDTKRTPVNIQLMLTLTIILLIISVIIWIGTKLKR